MFVCDFDVEDQFLGVIIQRFSCVIKFTAVEPLALNEFPYLCDELDDPFESRIFASHVSEIHLLCLCEVLSNESLYYRFPADAKDFRF